MKLNAKILLCSTPQQKSISCLAVEDIRTIFRRTKKRVHKVEICSLSEKFLVKDDFLCLLTKLQPMLGTLFSTVGFRRFTFPQPKKVHMIYLLRYNQTAFAFPNIYPKWLLFFYGYFKLFTQAIYFHYFFHSSAKISYPGKMILSHNLISLED